VNVARTQEESLFPQIKLNNGISSKATEYKKMAKSGDRWQSPIFSIGSAGESNHIPGASKVTRKNHETHPSRIRGENNLGQSVEQGYSNSNDHSFGKDKEYTGGASYAGGNQGYDGNNSSYGQQQGGYAGQPASYGQESYAQPSYAQPTYTTGQSDINYDSFDRTNGAVGGSGLNNYDNELQGGPIQTTLGLQNPVLKGIV